MIERLAALPTPSTLYWVATIWAICVITWWLLKRDNDNTDL